MVWKDTTEQQKWFSELSNYINNDDFSSNFPMSQTISYHFQWCDFTYNISECTTTDKKDRLDLMNEHQYTLVKKKRKIQTTCTFVRNHLTKKKNVQWPTTWELMKLATKSKWKTMIDMTRADEFDHTSKRLASLKQHAARALVNIVTLNEMLMEAKTIINNAYNFKTAEDCHWRSQWKSYKLNNMNCDFACKLQSPLDKKIVLIGDLHGGLYDLWDVIQKLLKDDENLLKIKNEIQFVVFLGDIFDRSYYSLETLTLVCTLLYHNQDKVRIVKGNHENLNIWLGIKETGFVGQTGHEIMGHCIHEHESLSGETGDIYSTNFDKVVSISIFRDTVKAIHEFLTELPVVIFVRFGTNNIQLCHGAFPYHSTGSWAFESKTYIELSKMVFNDAIEMSDNVKALLDTIYANINHEALKGGENIYKSLINYIKIYILDPNDISAIQSKGYSILPSLQHTTLMGSPAATNLSRPGVSFDDAMEWCRRMNLVGIYSGHQDQIDVAMHLRHPGVMEPGPYRNLHIGQLSDIHRNGEFILHSNDLSVDEPEIVITSNAIAARQLRRWSGAFRKGWASPCFLTLQVEM